MQSLLERGGAVATIAPSMREVPLSQNAAAFEFAESLLAGRIDVVVFLTGVGARALLEVMETRHERAALLAAIERTTTVIRGPKPAAVLREWGVSIDHRAPEPNTWHELLATIDAEIPVSGRAIAIQEYGQPHAELAAELTNRGARVTSVPVYRWELPEDVGPLEAAVRTTVEGGFDALLFTSAQQVRHVLEVADRLGLRNDWLVAARKCIVASIGPTCTETLLEESLPPNVEASPPKMGQLVRATLDFTSAHRPA